ncbi:hypothetical protein [Chamaesiphon sp. OTE_20_metabat_361]|uniref:hypothetical protein n=1 Tax=Chamaesiphon sp. OTE_20_metabat_361 TaxID=2964689 RepID=UPI00286CF3FB|nr:hypothetical protein [Chamaesiphon sp. OTE_20_metabat_361]
MRYLKEIKVDSIGYVYFTLLIAQPIANDKLEDKSDAPRQDKGNPKNIGQVPRPSALFAVLTQTLSTREPSSDTSVPTAGLRQRLQRDLGRLLGGTHAEEASARFHPQTVGEQRRARIASSFVLMQDVS